MKVYDPNDAHDRELMRKRDERRQSWVTFWAFVLIVVLGALDLLGNQLWYGDWSCAFVNCVRVQDVKNPSEIKP